MIPETENSTINVRFLDAEEKVVFAIAVSLHEKWTRPRDNDTDHIYTEIL